jgi:Pilus formation protein N terminal region
MRAPAFLFAGLVFGLAAAAQAETLVISIDHSQRLPIGGAVQSVVVGNPSVADVTVVDSHTLYVIGKSFGQTDVIVLDAYGRTLYQGDVVVGSANVGRVTVYRGGARTDMACAPNCQTVVRNGAPSSMGGGASGGASGGGKPNLGGGAAAALSAAAAAAPGLVTPGG